VGLRANTASVRLNLGLAYWRLSRLEDAHRLLEQVIHEMEGSRDPFGAAVGHTYLGLVLEQAELFEAARQHFEQASQALRQMNIPGYLHDALAGLARTSLALHQDAAARQACQEVWQFFTQPTAPAMELPQLARWTCVQVFSALDQPDLAGEALQNALQDIRQRAARLDDPALRAQFFQNIPEHRWLFEAAARGDFEHPGGG
jgi:tetratricopeptide (TPR) repeat protein